MDFLPIRKGVNPNSNPNPNPTECTCNHYRIGLQQVLDPDPRTHKYPARQTTVFPLLLSSVFGCVLESNNWSRLSREHGHWQIDFNISSFSKIYKLPFLCEAHAILLSGQSE